MGASVARVKPITAVSAAPACGSLIFPQNAGNAGAIGREYIRGQNKNILQDKLSCKIIIPKVSSCDRAVRLVSATSAEQKELSKCNIC
jgi:hypothetical protein